ncbi:MAG: spermidine synthase [Betaproteobacteria bacterium]
MPTPVPAQLPEVSFSEDDVVRHLHLGTPWIQGSMRRDAPYDIELEYVQRMMAWLLFVPAETVAERHAMQLGLGAAALTKFCYKKLMMRATAIELNEQVVLACRQWFRLPAPNERLRIVLADAAQEITRPQYAGTVDALQVDLYDEDAAAPVLDSPAFYADCRRLLTDDGVMSVNLFGRHASYEQSLAKMASAFGPEALWAFRPTREGNTVVLAQRRPQALERPLLVQRAQVIASKWGLPAPKWLKTLQHPG